MTTCDNEILSVEDLFENNDIVLMLCHMTNMLEYSAGLKDTAGDIVKIVTIGRRLIK
jgi:hypothetical protein